MRLAEKKQVAVRALASITRHDDADFAEVHSLCDFLVEFIRNELVTAGNRREQIVRGMPNG
jgi:hypothetical protein